MTRAMPPQTGFRGKCFANDPCWRSNGGSVQMDVVARGKSPFSGKPFDGQQF
jgi:hypothetical protein